MFVYELFSMHFTVYMLKYGRTYTVHTKSKDTFYAATDELLNKTRHGKRDKPKKHNVMHYSGDTRRTEDNKVKGVSASSDRSGVLEMKQREDKVENSREERKERKDTR